MPRFRVRLQDPEGPDYRVSYVTAENEDAAVAVAKRIDSEIVADENQPHTRELELAYVVERGQPVPKVTKWKVQPPDPTAAEV